MMHQYNKGTLYIKFVNETNKIEAIEHPVYVRRQERNNIDLRCNAVKAQGVVGNGGSTIYQFEDKPIMDSSYPIVKKITYAEFYEMQIENDNNNQDDPEISDEEALNIIMGNII